MRMKPLLAATAVVVSGAGLRQGALVLLVATVLVPAAIAGRYSPAPTPTTPSAQRVVVRTELVPANDGFDWLDAAAGFGLAMATVSVVLLMAVGHRPARN